MKADTHTYMQKFPRTYEKIECVLIIKKNILLITVTNIIIILLLIYINIVEFRTDKRVRGRKNVRSSSM